MRYRILVDGKDIYYQGDEEYVIINPEITVGINQAGMAKFGVPGINPECDSILNRKSMITVFKNEVEVFYGEARTQTLEMGKAKQVVAVGVLSFLNDSIQPQKNYGEDISAEGFIDKVLAVHNQQMLGVSRKIIRKGRIYIPDDEHYSIPMITDRETTLEAIKKNILDLFLDLYGEELEIRIRHDNNELYLDIFPFGEITVDNPQVIQMGDNIIDALLEYNAEDIKTVVIPLGAKLEDDGSGFEKRVTIKTVNNNKEYLVNNETKNRYGAVWTTVIFDDIEEPVDLFTAGSGYLYEKQFENAIFKITAVDLAAVDISISPFYLGQRVQLYSYAASGQYYIVEMTMKPLAPEDEKIIFSGNARTRRTTLTSLIRGR